MTEGLLLLRSLTKNERPWAIHSHCSEEMSHRERIAQVAHQKLANELIARFLSESLIRSFLGKKLAICSENRWANSQLCKEFNQNLKSISLKSQCFDWDHGLSWLQTIFPTLNCLIYCALPPCPHAVVGKRVQHRRLIHWKNSSFVTSFWMLF